MCTNLGESSCHFLSPGFYGPDDLAALLVLHHLTEIHVPLESDLAVFVYLAGGGRPDPRALPPVAQYRIGSHVCSQLYCQDRIAIEVTGERYGHIRVFLGGCHVTPPVLPPTIAAEYAVLPKKDVVSVCIEDLEVLCEIVPQGTYFPEDDFPDLVARGSLLEADLLVSVPQHLAVFMDVGPGREVRALMTGNHVVTLEQFVLSRKLVVRSLCKRPSPPPSSHWFLFHPLSLSVSF